MKKNNNFIPTTNMLAGCAHSLVCWYVCLIMPFPTMAAAVSTLHKEDVERVWQDGRKRIKGVVVDENGEPLPGINIMVKGTSIGVRTDMNGAYTIVVPASAETLVCSCIGMKTVEIAIGNKQVIRVVLQEDINQLGDVVVTGIFTKARESYTGSVSTITQEQLKDYRGQNLIQTLRNIDASLNIPMNNAVGSNPNVVPKMNIRGVASLPTTVGALATESSVNNPLVILDGVEVAFSRLMDLNDDEI